MFYEQKIWWFRMKQFPVAVINWPAGRVVV